MNADIDRKRGLRLAPWALAIALWGVLLISAPVRAADVVVTSPGDDGTANAANCPGASCRLRDAVAAANSGDRILFDATAFASAQTIQLTGGAIVIDRPLTLDGSAHGGATPTLAGPGASATFRLFDITGATTLQGLTLRDGNAGSANGGAIRTTAPLTLTAVAILSSTAYYGGGVYAEANVVISDSRLESNTATGPNVNNDVRRGGGGLYITGNLTATATDFVNNRTAGTGGGVSIRGNAVVSGGSFLRNATTNLSAGSGAAIGITGTLTLSGVQVISNTSGQAGGAIVAGEGVAGRGGDTTLIDTLFQENSSTRSSGGALYTYGSLTVIDTQFLTNTAKTKRGAINVGRDAFVSGSLFQGNAAVTDAAAYAGAMEVGGALALTDTHFIGNRASNTAGALFALDAVTITNSSFVNNTAGASAGAIEGGAPLVIRGSRFEGNSAGTYAGAISTYGFLTIDDSVFANNRAASEQAGALLAGSDATIRNSDFLTNTAGSYGGALDSQGILTLVDSAFRGNTAGSYAGAVYLNGSASFTGVVMEANRATGGGSYGGALVNNYNNVTLRDSTLAGNTAASYGGALFTEGGVLVIDGSSFEGNTATSGGGLYQASGVLTVTASYLRANSATNGGALNVTDGAASLANLVLTGNTAATGAAIYSGGNTQLLQSTVASPVVGGGAAIYVAGGAAGVTSTIVASYMTGIQQVGGVAAADYNLFFGNTTNKSGAVNGGANDVSGDPRFADPAADDYRLLPGSAALAAGLDVGVATDILGLGRGAPTTIGAYEKPAVAANNDAYLIDLQLRNVVLNHRFAPTMFGYASSVPNRMESTVVTPTATIAGASITVNGAPVGSGAGSAELPLVIGVNPITTVVTALDGTTALTYTVVITRRAYDGPFYVDKTVGDDDNNLCDDWGVGRACLTIAGAIEKASLPETYVYISGHTYTENLTTTLTMHFVGAGVGSTIIDGRQLNRVFTLSGAGVGGSFTGMTIQNGRVATGNGGGVLAGGAVTLTNVAVLTNTTVSGSGGGLYASGAVSLTNATFISNTANATNVDIHGGALYAGGAANITGGVFTNNWANLTGTGANSWARGGAIYAATALTMTGAQVSSNGVYARFTTAYATNTQGGGVFANSTATLRDTHFITNNVQSYSNVVNQSAYAYGGGLYAAGAASVNGGSFAGNTANVYMSALNYGSASGAGYSYGGGAYINGAVAISGTHFLSNTSTRIKVINPTYGDYATSCGGGGLYGYDAVTLAGAAFEGNVAICYSADVKGGGVFAKGATSVAATIFKANYAQSVSNTSFGGGLYADATLVVTASQFISNTNRGYAYGGGGGGLYTNGPLTLNNSQLISNTDSVAGGGLYAKGTIAIAGCLFQENVATSSEAGAAEIRDSTTTIDRSQFISNTSNVAGAMFVYNTTMSITNSRFTANRTTGNDGGAIYARDATVNATNVLFERNVASYGTVLYQVRTSGAPRANLAYVTIASPTVAGGPAIYQGDGTVVITNTLIANQSQSISKQGGALIADYNLLYNAPTNENVGAHSLTDADPVFVDAARGNYRLSAGSPAAGAGVVLAGVTTDLDGKSRGAPPTIGAYEGTVDIYLRSLALSSGVLTPTFTRTTTIYTARVAYAVASLVVTPTASSAAAVLTVNGQPNASGAASAPLALAVGPNPITVTVASADGLSTRDYVATVTRAGADLANLVLSSGPLTPSFAPGTTGYTASVPASVRTVTVTPTAADSTASITVNGAPVASGAASGPILLLSPTTVITTVVTAPGGAPVKTYTITIARPPRADADLIDLALTYGVLTPGFISATTSYTSVVDNAIASVAVIATSSDPFARLSVNGAPATSGQPSTPVTLAVGDNPIHSVVTSEDGLVLNTYTITVTRAAADAANPALAKLTVDRGPLSPAFAPATTSYSVAAVPYTITTAAVTPTAGELGAVLAVNGVPVASGAASSPINLAVGVNNLTTVITAPNGVTTRTYVVAITREPWKGPFYVDPATGNDANGCEAWGAGYACATLAGAVGKAVLPDTTIYLTGTTHSASNVTSALALHFVGAGRDRTIVNGSAGNRVFNLTGASVTSSFSDLTVQNGSFTSGANNPGAGIYATGSLSLTNVNILSNTTNSGSGAGVYAGGAITMTNGRVENNIGTTNAYGGGVNAQNGAVISDSQFIGNRGTYGGGLYVVNVGFTLNNTQFFSNSAGTNGGGAYVQAAPGNVVDGLFQGNSAGSNGGGIVCQSNVLTVDRTRFIANSAWNGAGIYLEPGRGLNVTNSLFAANTVGGAGAAFHYAAASGAADGNLRFVTIGSPATGANSAMAYANTSLNLRNTIVASYTTAATRYGSVGGVSGDYNLFYNLDVSGITTGAHSISGQDPLFFAPAAGNYHLRLGSPAIGAGSAVKGITTDLDGLTRADPPSMGAYEDPFYPYDVNLINLEPGAGVLAPDFAARTTRYTVRVANNVASSAFRPTASSPAATITVNGSAVTSGAWSAQLPLVVGPNVITTSVTATDTVTVKHYVVTVIRTGADLANLVLSSGPLAPSFAPDTASYTATVPNATRTVTVTPTAADPTASITVNGVPVTSSTPSGPISLVAGTNVITTVVTAEDSTTIKTYRITITRAPELINLALSVGVLTPAFVASTTSYTAAVGNAIASLAVIPTSSEAGSTITVNGSPVTSGAASGAIPLIAGETPITTVVTSQDGTTAKSFVVTVTRAPATAANATLANLALSSGPISPTFAPFTTSYTATVPFTVTDVTLTPTASEVGATLAVNGAPVASGSASAPINLAVGVNTATTVITAPNGVDTAAYLVAVTRLPWPGPYYVDKTVGDDANACETWGAGHACRTIGGAIAKAVITGTFIYISGHTYSENLTVTLPLNFVGSGSASTIIDGGQRTRVFNITGGGSAVAMSDLTVQNGLAAAGNGGGIYAAGALTLTNVNVLTNSVAAGDGGGIYAGGAASLTNVNVLNNTATRASGTNAYGGGMYAGAVQIRGSLFQNNRLLPIDGNNHWGGGLSVRSNTAVITSTQFISNFARAGGGLSIRDNGSAVITDTHFIGNWGNQDGGGLYSEAGSGVLRGANLLFARNFSNNGAALYYTNSSGASTLTFMTVVSPTIGNGSAIYKGLAGSLTIQNSIVASYTVGVRRDAGTFTSDYNLFYNAPTTEVTGTHSIAGADPRFLDQGAGNFRLKPGSPAIGKGIAVAGVTSDLDGLPRATPPTIGAYEGAYASPDLSRLLLSQGTLTPAFAPATTSYTATVGYTTTRLNVTAATVDASATITINSARAISGTAFGPIWLEVGPNPIPITVRATNGVTKSYSVVVTRASDGALLDLAIDPGTLTPYFDPESSVYTAAVGYVASPLIVTATASAGDLSSVAVAPDGGAQLACTGSPVRCPLAVGDNLVTATVTTIDGAARPYTITVTRATDATLRELTLGAATLYPQPFISTTLAYTAVVAMDAVSTTVIPTTTYAADAYTITVTPTGGATTACAGAPATCPLVIGRNVVTITVTATDKLTRTYAVVVSRASDATLSGLELSATTYEPTFISTTLAYTAPVTLNEFVVSTFVTATTTYADDVATFAVAANGGGAAACSGTPVTCPLSAGLNIITATVTNPNGGVRRYTVAVERAPSTNAWPLSLALSPGTLTPAFVTTTLDYTASVPNSVAAVTVTVRTEEPNATITVNGAAVVSGTASSSIPLLVGETVITTVVTAQDLVTSKLYTITVTRASEARLDGLALDPGVLTPAYISTTQAYSAVVTMATVSTTVTYTPAFASDAVNTVVAANGGAPTACADGSPTGCPLELGRNVITLTVTASDASTRAYTIVVRRPGDATLAVLALSATTFTPAFISTTVAYTGVALVPYTTPRTLVTATTTYPDDQVAVVAAPVGRAETACTAAPVDCPLAVGDNVLTVTVTAADNTVKTYTVAVTRATDATLADLTLGAAAIDPQPFLSTTLAYTAAVSMNTASTTVIPTTTFAADTYTITAGAAGGGEAICAGAPAACPLAVGRNVITITVAATDGFTRVYTVTVRRAGDATLAGLELSATAYTPAFISTTLAYSGVAVVDNLVASTLVTATTAYPDDAVAISAAARGGAPAACSGVPASCPLAVGENVITATVTAADNTTQHYTVIVNRAPSSDAALLKLALTPGVLAPVFVSSTLDYTATVAHSAVTVTLTPSTNEPNATITVAGAAVLSGAASAPIPLSVGANTITTVVTAQDTATTRTYTVTVTRAGDASLSALAIQPGVLTPGYISTTLAYTAVVSTGTASTTVAYTPTYASDTVAIVAAANGSAPAACLRAASADCPLAIGVNVITVTVTAADATTRSYTITLRRAGDATLAGLALSATAYTPAFLTTTLAYTGVAPVSYPTAGTLVTVTTPYADDVTGVVVAPAGGAAIVCAGTPANCPLAVGANTITVTVIAVDGSARHYTVGVTRASDARLSSLALAAAPLTPAFISTTLTYTAAVGLGVESSELTPTVAFAGDTISVTVAANGGAETACTGAPLACPLAFGANVIRIVVTAAYLTTRTYAVTVTRAGDATLAGLELSATTYTPVFISTTFAYTGASVVVHAVTGTWVTATTSYPSDVAAIVAAPVGGTPAVCPGAPAACALAVGENRITVTVTAVDNTVKPYTVRVTRASDGALAGLVVDAGALQPVFVASTLAYTTAAVGHATASTLVTATAALATDAISITAAASGGAEAACSTAPVNCPLAVGANVITVTVTPDAGPAQVYTVGIVRASAAQLSGLEVSVAPLTPAFLAATLAYTTPPVSNAVESTLVTATVAQPGDAVTVMAAANGAPATACSAAPVNCPLAVGANTITVTVTAADGSRQAYTVGIARAPSSEARLIDLALSHGRLTPVFAVETTGYTATVGAQIASLVVTPTASAPHATITVNGAPVPSGAATAPIPLGVGENAITTTVTAQDGVTVRHYVVIVTRPALGVMAVNDAVGVFQGNAVVAAPLVNDHDPVGGGLRIAGVGQAEHGVVVIDAGAQTVTYTPDPDFSGVDSFTCTVQDVNGSTDTALVAVVVTAQSQAADAPQLGLVDNQTGAELNFVDTGLLIDVQAPAGSYTGTLGPKDIFYLVYTPVLTPTGDVHQPPNGLRFGNLVFDLSAYFNDTLLPGYRFPAPLTLVIAYDPARLGGLSEAALAVYYWNGAAWSAEGVMLIERDLTNHTVTIALAHLSELAFFSSEPTALEPAPEPGLVAPRLYLPVVTSAGELLAVPAAPVPTETPVDVEIPVATETPVDTETPVAAPTPDVAVAPPATNYLHLPLVAR